MRLVADIEADGLLDTITKVHCIVAIDVDTEEVHRFRPHQIENGIDFLRRADEVAFHNGIGYDHPALEKLYPEKPLSQDKVFDTIVASRLIWSNLKDIDGGLIRKKKLEGRYFGSHALKAWGYRLGRLKGEFHEDADWSTFSEPMLEYCEQDCWVTLDLYRKIREKNYSQFALDLEHDVAWLMTQQERNGFYFNEQAAAELYAELAGRREEIRQELVAAFGEWYQAVTKYGEPVVMTPKRSVNYKDKLRPSTEAGAPFTKVEHLVFNPASRVHIATRMKALYGWESPERTEKGAPKIDETTLSGVDNPHAKMLVEYFMLEKRIGQIAEGDQAWLKQVDSKGFIHGRVNTNAAVTGRCTHSNPNVAQVPANGKPYGKECRQLFTVPQDWKLFGADASGLELRCLGHYMAKYDDGAYIEQVLNGDIHTANQQAAGLPTRNNAKTFILNLG